MQEIQDQASAKLARQRSSAPCSPRKGQLLEVFTLPGLSLARTPQPAAAPPIHPELHTGAQTPPTFHPCTGGTDHLLCFIFFPKSRKFS